jgi:glycolate oxidase
MLLGRAKGSSAKMEARQIAEGLRRFLLPGQVIDSPSELITYSTDASFYSHLRPHAPDVVVVARSTEDVQRTVTFAAEHRIPITPRGASSGQTGGSIPVRGGIVIALSAMNRLLELDTVNLQAMVEPGIIHARLNLALAPHSLIFPPDPGSSRMCTVGGMASTNAHGMRAVKYGPTSHWVLGLEVVLADGRLITTGSINSKARQSASGLELTKLFVGAEGILGVITKLRLKVMPMPQSRAIVTALFDDLERAGQAVVEVSRAAVTPAAAEILDRNSIQAVNLYRPSMQLASAEAMLLFEVDGNPAGVEYDAQRVSEVVRPLAISVEWSNEPKRIAALWEARSVVGAAASMLRPGAFRAYCGEDLCVPISKVPATLKAIQEIGKRHDIAVATYGHIGGGGMHPGHLIDPSNPDEVRRVLLVADAIHKLALEMGGTVTGEHGVGLVRAPYMAAEHGEALDVMRQIKQALDPHDIMNPGKIVSQTSADLLIPGREPAVSLQAVAGVPVGVPPGVDLG